MLQSHTAAKGLAPSSSWSPCTCWKDAIRSTWREESLLLGHASHPITMLYAVVVKANYMTENLCHGQMKHLLLARTEELSKRNMPVCQLTRRERAKHLWIWGRWRLWVLLWRRKRLLQKGVALLSISENVIILIRKGVGKILHCRGWSLHFLS